MRQNGGQGQKSILCVGQLKHDRVLVISRDYLVYDLPVQSLDSSVGKLYFNGTEPVPLAQKWPKLGNDAHFLAVKDIAYNAFFFVTDKEEFFFLTVKSAINPGLTGVTYDIEHQVASGKYGLTYNGKDDDLALIGSYMRPEVYAMHRAGHRLEMSLFRMNKCYPSWLSDILQIKNWICSVDSETSWYQLCENGSGQISIGKNASKGKCTSPDWPVLNGFVTNGVLYLFGPSYVITFHESIWEKKGKPVKYTKHSYDSFIRCSVADARDMQLNAAPRKMAIVISIVLALLILLLCCALFGIVTVAKRGKKRPKSSERRSMSKESKNNKRSKKGAKNKTSKKARGERPKDNTYSHRTQRSVGDSVVPAKMLTKQQSKGRSANSRRASSRNRSASRGASMGRSNTISKRSNLSKK